MALSGAIFYGVKNKLIKSFTSIVECSMITVLINKKGENYGYKN